MNDTYLHQDRIPKIDEEVHKQLSKLNPWRSILAIILDWLIIILCIVLCEMISYWLYPMAFIVVGSRFHGLEAMMHEATHFRLHPNRTINEWIGELSVWSLGISVLLYRHARHFSHHKNIGSRKDAHTFQSYDRFEERFDLPMPLRQLVKNCIIVAIKFPQEIWWGQLKSTALLLPKFSKIRAKLWLLFQMLTVLLILVGSIIVGLKVLWIYLLFFVLPLMWIAVFSRYLRLLSEHFGIPTDSKVVGSETRTFLVSWPVRVVFWPHLLNYHLEHHWYPSVPFYNLPKLHKILQSDPDAKAKMHVTSGVENLIGELTYVKPKQ